MGMLLDHDRPADDTALVDEFADWLIAAGHPDAGAMAADADMFVDWRRRYSTGILDAFDKEDLADFLLNWCPRTSNWPTARR